jgi:hypothetical protein
VGIMAFIRPNVGDWYEDLDENTTFTILSVDNDADVIEIQYEDGSIEEINMDSWKQMSLDKIEPPEEWIEDLDAYEDFDDDDDDSDLVEGKWSDAEDYGEYE